MKHILVADDDKDIRELVKIYLQAEGLNVDTVSDGVEVIDKLKERTYDLVILDIMMPKMDGLKTLIEIRKNYKMPVIFLTAKNEEIDLIQGLSLGADDYIGKPFSSMTLLARVKAQLRRYTVFNHEQKDKIIIDELTVETNSRQVTVKGEDVKLTPTEYKILELLCKHRNQVFSVEQIYEAIWRDKCAVGDTSIMVHITKLRQKLEKDPKNPEYIKTVWGVGYKV